MLQYRTHAGEVLLAPKGNIEVPCDCVGVLPQVEMELPVLRLWKNSPADLKDLGNGDRLSVEAGRETSLILAGNGILRDVDGDPDGPDGLGRNGDFFVPDEPVGP